MKSRQRQLMVRDESQVFRLVREAAVAGVRHGVTAELVIHNVRVDRRGVLFFCDISGITMRRVLSGEADEGSLPYAARIHGRCAPGYHDLEVTASVNGRFDMEVIGQQARQNRVMAY